ncbi:MAG: Rossmann-like fold-containing protein [Pseudomonadota bacterium]
MQYYYERLPKAGLRLKYALSTQSKLDFVRMATTGSSLFVGEGNLSFSLGIARQLETIERARLVASTFESACKWSDETVSNARQLIGLGCTVLDKLDARSIDREFGAEVFDFIGFQFPNVGSRKLKHGRNPNHVLLRRFLKSAANAISRHGAICVTTVNNPYYDGAFSVDDAARWAGLPKPVAYRFDPDDYAGYFHTNTLDQSVSSIGSTEEFVTFVFRKA